MVALHRKGWGLGVALVAALILMLQTAVGALAMGQGTPPLDIFGNPLCITTSTNHTAPAKSEHPTLPECCTLGCNMFATQMAYPPEAAVLFVERLPEVVVRLDPARLDPPSAPEHDPGSPRAPPAA